MDQDDYGQGKVSVRTRNSMAFGQSETMISILDQSMGGDDLP